MTAVRVAPAHIPISEVQRVVAKQFNLTRETLVGPSRKRTHTRPRQIAMTLAREYCGRSLPAIGAAFGGRDHTTVLHAIGRIRNMPQLAKHLGAIRAELDTLAELHNLDALSGRVFLASQMQYEWPLWPEPRKQSQPRSPKKKPATELPAVSAEAFIPGSPIPSAFPRAA